MGNEMHKSLIVLHFWSRRNESTEGRGAQGEKLKGTAGKVCWDCQTQEAHCVTRCVSTVRFLAVAKIRVHYALFEGENAAGTTHGRLCCAVN